VNHQKISCFGLIFLLSFLATFLVLQQPLLFHTHDGPVHLARQAAWFKLFWEGQIPPRWADGFNYGSGSPVLIFMYPWPYFLGSLFLGVGLNLATTFKIVCLLSFWLSGIFLFGFAREFLGDEKKALLASILYQFASFRFAEIIIRGAYGEIWAYTFLPLVLWGLTKITHKRYWTGFLLTSFGSGLLILSHNSVSLAFFLTAILFAFFFNRQLTKLIASGLALVFGLGLAAFYWLPALYERRFTYGDLFMKDIFKDHFPTLTQLFLPNFLNTASSQVGDVPVQIGFFHLLALFLAIVFYCRLKKSREKKLLVFCLVISALALFLMQPISQPLWNKIALLRQFQFPWRLLSLIVLASSLAGAVVYSRCRWLIIILVVLASVAYWRPTGFDAVDEAGFWDYPLSSTYYGEADTIWLAHQPSQYPEQEVAIVAGEGQIAAFQKSFDQQAFTVAAQTKVNVLSHTQFFPGWRVYVDGQETQIEFQDQNYRGLVTFRLPAGRHQVLIKFTHTKDRLLAEMISLLSLMGCLLVFALKRDKILAHLGQRWSVAKRRRLFAKLDH